MNKPLTLSDLVQLRIAAKRAEDDAIEARRNIDAQITALLPSEKTEGTVSEKLGDYKITVTYGVTRKVDAEEIRTNWDKLSSGAQEAIDWKPSLSVSKFRKLSDVEMAQLSKFIETKPSAPTVKIDIA